MKLVNSLKGVVNELERMLEEISVYHSAEGLRQRLTAKAQAYKALSKVYSRLED